MIALPSKDDLPAILARWTEQEQTRRHGLWSAAGYFNRIECFAGPTLDRHRKSILSAVPSGDDQFFLGITTGRNLQQRCGRLPAELRRITRRMYGHEFEQAVEAQDLVASFCTPNAFSWYGDYPLLLLVSRLGVSTTFLLEKVHRRSEVFKEWRNDPFDSDSTIVMDISERSCGPKLNFRADTWRFVPDKDRPAKRPVVHLQSGSRFSSDHGFESTTHQIGQLNVDTNHSMLFLPKYVDAVAYWELEIQLIRLAPEDYDWSGVQTQKLRLLLDPADHGLRQCHYSESELHQWLAISPGLEPIIRQLLHR